MAPSPDPPTPLISREALEELLAASQKAERGKPTWTLSQVAFGIVVVLLVLFVGLVIHAS